MYGDIYLGRLFGIPFRLHWSWFLAVVLIAWTLAVNYFPTALPAAQDKGIYWMLGVIAALGLFVSVLLHELGHAFAAHAYGIVTRGIRLFIFGGVAELSGEPRRPMQEIVIAIAGPAVTVLLIIVFILALVVMIQAGVTVEMSDEAGIQIHGPPVIASTAALLYYLGMINTFLLIFNLIPAFPLDGGRVLRGIVWLISGDYLLSTRLAAGVGIAFSWVLFIGGFLLALSGNLLGGVWFFFLGMFLQNAAASSVAYATMQQLLRGVRVADLMCRDVIVLPPGLTIREVVNHFFLRRPYKAYPVVQDGQFVGLLTLDAIQNVPIEEWESTTAGEVAAQGEAVPTLRPHEPAINALRKLAETDLSRLPVVENGQFYGLLCRRDLMHYLEIRSSLALPRYTN